MIRDLQSRILFEDNHLLVFDKPAGVWCAGSADGEDTVESILKNHIKRRDQKTGEVYLNLVHRIDRLTSGCVLLAKTSKATTRMSKLIRERGLFKKKYLALVEGSVDFSNLEWRDFIYYDSIKARGFCVAPNDSRAKEAHAVISQTQFVCCEKDISSLQIELLTGRRHQIRIQCAYRNHPILGDGKYGSKRNLQGFICLHAWQLEFFHPVGSHQLIATEAAIPRSWQPFLS